MNDQFKRVTESTPEIFRQLMASTPFTEKGIASQKARSGVYVLLEEGVPLHVGRTRNLGGRLRGHISRSHYSASFALKRTRRLLGKLATYLPEGSRSQLAKDQAFKSEFYRQIDLVRGMTVKFVEVRDPIAQYLLELYAHLELGLPLDEFETH